MYFFLKEIEQYAQPKILFVIQFLRYYGLRKISTPTVSRAGKSAAAGAAAAAASAAAAKTQKKPPQPTVARPIITVTEFTPGNTPDRVRRKIKAITVSHPFLSFQVQIVCV